MVEEIKSRCGQDFPVVLRFSLKSMIKDWREGALPGEIFEEKGRDIEEGLETAKLLVQYGYDALDTDVGTYDAWWWNHPPMYQKKGLFRPYCKMVKEAVDVPVLCAGRMDNPEMASEAVEAGECDIVSLGRPLLADPDYVNKLRAGKWEQRRSRIHADSYGNQFYGVCSAGRGSGDYAGRGLRGGQRILVGTAEEDGVGDARKVGDAHVSISRCHV